MQQIPIRLSPDCDPSQIADSVDRAITDLGLTTTLRTTLKSYPGCIHWHVKRNREPGTLEITLWPQENRAWFTIQSGRKGPWIKQCLDPLQSAIRRRSRGV